jgi:hypothetical protein
MSEMTVVRKTVLNERHLRPGRMHHTIHDKNGKREFPPFTSLFITDSKGHSEVVMWRLCENGEAAHTHHDSIDDAFRQAEYEFEVIATDWVETNEPFHSLKNYAER